MENKERPVVDFTTTGGKKLVLKSYITGKEFKVIENIYTEGAEVSVVNGQPVINGFDMKSESKATDKLIELIVVSVDESTDNILDTIGDLPKDDYIEIIDRINEISGKKKAEPTTTA